MAQVVKEFQKKPDRFVCRGCVTGRHQEMPEQAPRFFDFRPSCDLDIMQANQSLTQLIFKALASLEPMIASERIAGVLVQRDITTPASRRNRDRYLEYSIGGGVDSSRA